MGQGFWKIPDILNLEGNALIDDGYPRLLASILTSRGIKNHEDAAAFLKCRGIKPGDPFELLDMDRAVARIERALEVKERVAVYGDYDVDGITASCLLCDYLTGRGMDCRIYIPDRIDEGYGINPEALGILAGDGVSLVITVDCGITSAGDMAVAKSLGLDIIITDHHECPSLLPDCCAVVDPKRQEDFDAPLAGVGVAMKLACALEGNSETILERYCDLVAVGTVADVMPLVGENRLLVCRGLDKLRKKPRPAFAALLQEAGAAEKSITASVIGYTIAPRINAAGRLCKTHKAVELLMSEDEAKVKELAIELCALNRRRQELEAEVFQDATEILANAPPEGPIVLAGEAWHPGVVGIAASRVAEEHQKPAIIICLDGEEGKGSCRSWGEFNLFDGLSACSEHLEGFGGHAFAAGINIKRDKVDAFRKALSEYWNAHMPEPAAELEPEIQLEDLSALTVENVKALDYLEPCGAGNPKPLFCIRDVFLDELSPIGGGKHLRVVVCKNGFCVSGVFFGQTLENLPLRRGDRADICFTPQINEFRGRVNVQLLLAGIRRAE